jgi:hypothetical protein
VTQWEKPASPGDKQQVPAQQETEDHFLDDAWMNSQQAEEIAPTMMSNALFSGSPRGVAGGGGRAGGARFASGAGFAGGGGGGGGGGGTAEGLAGNLLQAAAQAGGADDLSVDSDQYEQNQDGEADDDEADDDEDYEDEEEDEEARAKLTAERLAYWNERWSDAATEQGAGSAGSHANSRGRLLRFRSFTSDVGVGEATAEHVPLPSHEGEAVDVTQQHDRSARALAAAGRSVHNAAFPLTPEERRVKHERKLSNAADRSAKLRLAVAALSLDIGAAQAAGAGGLAVVSPEAVTGGSLVLAGGRAEYKRGEVEIRRTSKLRGAWKPCTLQLSKKSLSFLRMSEEEREQDKTVAKTYAHIALNKVEQCFRIKASTDQQQFEVVRKLPALSHCCPRHPRHTRTAVRHAGAVVQRVPRAVQRGICHAVPSCPVHSSQHTSALHTDCCATLRAARLLTTAATTDERTLCLSSCVLCWRSCPRIHVHCRSATTPPPLRRATRPNGSS